MLSNTEELRNLLARLARNGRFTEAELKRAYRLLSKQTHPDSVQTDGELFIRLRDAYDSAQIRLQQRRLGLDEHNVPVPGLHLLTNYGYPPDIPAGAAFYVLIQSYFQKGVFRKKVYQKDVLRPKNRELIDAIEFWSGRYSQHFPEVFQDFRRHLNLIFPLVDDTQRFIVAQRRMVKGILAATWYQDEGKQAHKTMAADRLLLAEDSFRRITHPELPVTPMRRINTFFLEEIQHPSVNFRKFQGHWGSLTIL